jgi:RNA polymerase sigma factor (sigma-70 family)
VNRSEKPDPLEKLFPLLFRLKEGDLTAREDLAGALRTVLPDLVRPKFRRDFPGLRNLVQTDDIVQEVIGPLVIRLFSMAPETAEHFRNLVWLTIRHTLLDLVRKHSGPEKRRRRVKVGGPEFDDAVDIDRRKHHDLRLDIRQRIAELPDEEADLIICRFYLDMEIQEIAALLGVDRATVRRRLTKILDQLGKSLEP